VLQLPWDPTHNALVYALQGSGSVGAEGRPFASGELAVFGAGDRLTIAAAERQPRAADPGLEVLVLGGEPIGEPVAAQGPFVMNTRAELVQAMEDYRAGRLGVVPPGALMPFYG